jgi:hypothetical protein
MDKIMNTEPKKKNRGFNIVDVFIVIIIAAAAAAAWLIFSGYGTADAPTQVGIEYVIELRDVRDELYQYVKTGVPIIDSSKKYNIGEVINAERTPMIVENYSLKDSVLVLSEKPERSLIRLTVHASAVKEATGYSLGGYHLAVGTQIYVRTPSFCGTGYAISVKEISQ